MTWGGGVGSGLMTDAIDILLTEALGDGAADGVVLGYGFIDRGGGPFEELGFGLMASGGGAGVVGVEWLEWICWGEGFWEVVGLGPGLTCKSQWAALSENAADMVPCFAAHAEDPQKPTPPSDSPQSSVRMQLRPVKNGKLSFQMIIKCSALLLGDSLDCRLPGRYCLGKCSPGGVLQALLVREFDPPEPMTGK